MRGTRTAVFAALGLALALGAAPMAAEAQQVTVSTPSRAGPVNGVKENSDAFIWRLFAKIVAPAGDNQVTFETWASDEDTFNANPRWPSLGEPKKLHPSVLSRKSATNHSGFSLASLDAPCRPPSNPASGAFPQTGTPTPCIAEETRRNRPQFDYIVANKLNSQTGLAAAYARKFKVAMPTASVAIKGDWVPVVTLLQWMPQLQNPARVRTVYYTTTAAGVEYALLSVHISSRQNPNWVWGTLEHRMNPGRCDSSGCFDTFGATKPTVLPNLKVDNSQYGACDKTPALLAAFKASKASAVWNNYCLKGTQVAYVNAVGTPFILGNSVIERTVGNTGIFSSSCIGCHVYASFGANGQPTANAIGTLTYNPIGRVTPATLTDSLQFDFMWGVVTAPK